MARQTAKVSPIATGAAILIAAVGLRGSAQRVDPAGIVAEHYPIDRLEPEDDRDKHSCFQIGQRDARGEPTLIVAGYTDFRRAVLRVLSRTPDGAFAAAYDSPEDLRLTGMFCEVTLVDVDGNGQQDVLFELAAMRHSVAWVFRRTATGWENVTPMDRAMISDLVDVSFVDVRHDGTLQIVSIQGDPRDQRRIEPNLLYRLGLGGYAPDRPVLVVEKFSTDPALGADTIEFDVPENSDGPYTLRVVNGDRHGRRRAKGGSVTLNARTVVQHELSEHVEFLTIPLGESLPVENTLRVRLEGPPETQVTITIEED